MDHFLYNKLRESIVDRLALEATRAEQMLSFVENFAKYIQTIATQKWTVCYIGTVDNNREFVIGRPPVEERTKMPFALQINFTDPDDVRTPKCPVVVRFFLSWSYHTFTLRSIHSGASVTFHDNQISDRDVLKRASELLDEPLKDAVEAFLR